MTTTTPLTPSTPTAATVDSKIATVNPRIPPKPSHRSNKKPQIKTRNDSDSKSNAHFGSTRANRQAPRETLADLAKEHLNTTDVAEVESLGLQDWTTDQLRQALFQIVVSDSNAFKRPQGGKTKAMIIWYGDELRTRVKRLSPMNFMKFIGAIDMDLLSFLTWLRATD